MELLWVFYCSEFLYIFLHHKNRFINHYYPSISDHFPYVSILDYCFWFLVFLLVSSRLFVFLWFCLLSCGRIHMSSYPLRFSQCFLYYIFCFRIHQFFVLSVNIFRSKTHSFSSSHYFSSSFLLLPYESKSLFVD